MKPIYLATLVGLAVLISGLYLPLKVGELYDAIEHAPEPPQTIPEAHTVIPDLTIEQKIYAKAAEYGIYGDTFILIALCESNLNPAAANPSSTAFGVMQITYDTWMDGVKRRGLDWEWDEVMNENKNIDMAAWWISKGYIHKWDSSIKCWQYENS